MVQVFANDGYFSVKGTFDFGYIGLYRDEQIEIQEDSDEIRNWDFIPETADAENCSDEELAAILTDYINGLEQNIKQNIKQVNDNFLLRVFEDMEACGADFWEIEALTVADAMPENPEEEIWQPNHEILHEMIMEYDQSANDGSIEKTDVEAQLRKCFPMFNFDRFIRGIVPENICFFDTYVSFQCSDQFEQSILCAAYDNLDEDLCFTDWHNF